MIKFASGNVTIILRAVMASQTMQERHCGKISDTGEPSLIPLQNFMASLNSKLMLPLSKDASIVRLHVQKRTICKLSV